MGDLITPDNWDLWLLGSALAWVLVEFIGWCVRGGPWIADYPYDDDM